MRWRGTQLLATTRIKLCVAVSPGTRHGSKGNFSLSRRTRNAEVAAMREAESCIAKRALRQKPQSKAPRTRTRVARWDEALAKQKYKKQKKQQKTRR